MNVFCRGDFVVALATLLALSGCSNDNGTESAADASVQDAMHVDTDSGGTDAGVTDAALVDAGISDAGVVDATIADQGVTDAGEIDAGEPDATVGDAGTLDAGEIDAGTPDAGTIDAGTTDAGEVDAGAPDAGVVDAGAPDSGTTSASNGSCTWTYMSNTYCEQADSSIDEGEVRLQCSYVEGTFNYVCPLPGRIGSCQVGAAGQPGVLWFYSPMTIMAAMMSCSAQSGIWLGAT